MSYQSFLKSTGNSNTVDKSPSPAPIPRKHPLRSSPTGLPSVHTNVTRNGTSSSATSTPFTPTSSTNSVLNTPPPKTPSDSDTNREPARRPLTKWQIDAAMKTCLELQSTATTLHDKRPFAALLLGPDNTTVLLTHFSISHVQHAETELARLATIHFSQKFLSGCTLVSTWEPCAMCTGTLYWSNIGRLVYAASEEKLKDLTGGNNDENMTMSLPCRDVLKAGQKEVEVIGPVTEWEEKVVQESGKWWKEHQLKNEQGAKETEKLQREGSINGSEKPGSLSSTLHGTPTTWTGEENVLSRIDDEGEYKADLDIDWIR